jgi:hypothetical protein
MIIWTTTTTKPMILKIIPAVAKPSFGIEIDLDLLVEIIPRIREMIGTMNRHPEHRLTKDIIPRIKLIIAKFLLEFCMASFSASFIFIL